MASYYHTHQHMTPTQISNNDNLHTLLLMNHPDLAIQHQHQHQHHHHQQQQVPSNNILLLNSAAAAAAFSQPSPPIFPHHLVRLPPPENNEVTLYGYPQEAARDRQGLSLSLSQNNNDNPLVSGQGQVSVLRSKYLRATQELLEEVVNVGDTSNGNDHCYSPKKGKATAADTPSEGREKDSSSGHGDGDGAHQLSTVERHDIQMKKAKLVAMLDEAEQRYRHYNNQMQMVIESFESGAGMGSAKTYTSLALKTISKQFRCLKEAIQGQIRAANKSLGEDDGGSFGGKLEGPRLKFIDHQIRQQRALQQLGMIQSHNAWRPQRGLPERSVSVLRAWLFEHFLHPYPKDSDKILLAKQTGLTRGQVSNWFINARVRLWKPMIEEMYNEELKEQEKKGSEEKSSSKENSNNEEIGDMANICETPSSTFMSSVPTSSVFTLNNGSVELEGENPKRQRSNNEVVNNGEILIKFGNDEKERRDGNGYPIIPEGMNFMGGYGSNNMGDLAGRFETEDFNAPRYVQGNGGISLSLGLPPSCENHHHQQFNSITETNHTFISPNQSIRQFQHGTDFQFIDIQNRKGFAAQLLPDFAA